MPHTPTTQSSQTIISPADDDWVRQASGAPARQGDLAHPVFAYLGALGGLDTAIGDFARRLGLDFDAGPVLGRCEIAFPTALRVGRTYRVDLQVTDRQRKASRKYGTADHLGLEISLSSEGTVASRLRFTMITPAGPVQEGTVTVPPPVADLENSRAFGPVPGDDMAIWCRLLNDENAIHLSQDAARRAGFGPRRVNPGPANLAFLIAYRMQAYPARPLSHVTAQFLDNVFENDVLQLSLDASGHHGLITRDGHALLAATFTE